jgi:trehalose-phosphatase
MSSADGHAIASAILSAAAGRHLLLMCDFDGTLAEFHPDPTAVFLSPARRAVLEALAARPRTTVAIVSGRRLEDVRLRTGLPPVVYFAGLHGLEIAGGGETFVHPDASAARDTVQRVATAIATELDGMAGVFVEDKDLSIALHFREAAPAVQAQVVRVFERIAGAEIEAGGLRVMRGASVLELLPDIAWTKGNAVTWIGASVERRQGDTWRVYFGDDVTDQDAFGALGPRGTSVAASDRVTGARFQVDGPPGVESVLRAIR